MTIQKDVLYDVEWQVLRVSCLKDFHPKGGWIKTEGVKDNLDRLNDYITKSGLTWQEYFRRSWRVLNCLNAVREGYSGQGRADDYNDKLVTEFRDFVQKLYRQLKGKDYDFGEWDWEEVKSDLIHLFEKGKIWFDRIYKNLNSRRNASPSQLKFLELMDQVKKV